MKAREGAMEAYHNSSSKRLSVRPPQGLGMMRSLARDCRLAFHVVLFVSPAINIARPQSEN